ncbi:MAG: endonuclease MutS2 [Vulcanimicrobiaceae bacterium]
MLADERTLEVLDFAAIVERVVARTRTQRGRAKALALLPLDDFEAVRRAQAQTSALRDAMAAHDLHLLAAVETASLTQTAARGGVLSGNDLRSIGDALAAAAAARRAIQLAQDPILQELIAGYSDLSALGRRLIDAFDERGTLQDRASAALGRIRRDIARASSEARNRVSAIMRSARHAKAIQDTVVTIREGRFVIPIKAEFGGEFPGIVHDTSSSGQTLFVEPLAALEVNNRVRSLHAAEEREAERILAELSQLVGSRAAAIDLNVEGLARVDLVAARAELASAMDAGAPELVDGAEIVIDRGRHPLLAARAIPQSLALADPTRLLVISGPNMGGKSVALKMVGLFVAMAYAGLHLPAGPATRIGRFDHVLADIGDDQSIAENTSTFSAHMVRMREMLQLADERTLILVDEIGGGTEPGAGTALATAILERLLAVHACGVVTTHATELKLFAHAQTGITNASVRFNADTFEPTYSLEIGAPGQSLAFPLAQRLGIPVEILRRAAELLGVRERDYESALADLAMRSAELAQERDRLQQERQQFEERARALSVRTQAFEGEREAFAGRAEEELRRALRAFVEELGRRSPEAAKARVTRGQSAAFGRALDDLRREAGLVRSQPAPDTGAALQPGDHVWVQSLRQDGVMVEDYGESILVAIGSMKTVVLRADLQFRPSKGRAQNRVEGGSARLAASTGLAMELDVRGMRYVEAEPLVERWLDEAQVAGQSPLRLIHGKGTGLLGRGLQEYLRAHPAVQALRFGNADEGGSGVTIVDLREA